MIKRIPTPFSYSSAVSAGDYVFIGLHRGIGETFQEQIHDLFTHLQRTLRQCDTSLDQIVKVSVHLKHIEDLPAMEKVFLDYFEPDQFPARMTTTTAFIDDDCLLMIEGIAYNPGLTSTST
ncbi:2-iminobutanoate/2-iminopropanoate deaminase [Fontibacillus phaseoli]|uniref:2-iminobutanoate/2-iminopropanoate deaminase n=1 Tax=Fontibacillus phaseoli TaxID=1416533 RepID=A0A369B921_9BACL|nr:RidA family protein [Fontibacillus phaseoli]RCX17088.1 2-iminobutanoate/2-iminopropanoate deaminase [Fontibacillus phaseoli]